MAKLRASKRNALPKSSFGLPGKRKYPMPDKSHAANAKARASQQVAKGNLSKSSEAKIDAKANKVLGEKKGNPAMAKKFGRGASTDKGPGNVASTTLHQRPAAKSASIPKSPPSHFDSFAKKFGNGHNPGQG